MLYSLYISLWLTFAKSGIWLRNKNIALDMNWWTNRLNYMKFFDTGSPIVQLNN